MYCTPQGSFSPIEYSCFRRYTTEISFLLRIWDELVTSLESDMMEFSTTRNGIHC